MIVVTIAFSIAAVVCPWLAVLTMRDLLIGTDREK